MSQIALNRLEAQKVNLAQAGSQPIAQANVSPAIAQKPARRPVQEIIDEQMAQLKQPARVQKPVSPVQTPIGFRPIAQKPPVPTIAQKPTFPTRMTKQEARTYLAQHPEMTLREVSKATGYQYSTLGYWRRKDSERPR